MTDVYVTTAAAGEIPWISLTKADNVTYMDPTAPAANLGRLWITSAGILKAIDASTTYTYVEKDATQTLTGKTLTSPTINTPTISNGSISGTTINNAVIGGVTPAAATVTALTATTGTFTDIVNITKTTQQLSLNYDGSNKAAFTVSSGGDLTIAPTGGDTSITGTLAVSGHVAVNTTISATQAFVVIESYSSIAGTSFGINASTTHTLGANNANGIRGLASTVSINQNSFNATSASAGIAGNYIALATGSSGTVTGLIAVTGLVRNDGAGTLASGYSFQAAATQNLGGGTYTSFAAFASNAQTGATNNTYVLLGTVTIPSGNWTIHATTTNDSALAGKLSLGQTTAPAAQLDVQQGTLGNAVTRFGSTATNDDPSEIIYQNRVTTTDATQTTLHTFTVPASTTYQIMATVTARRTGGSAGTAEDGAGYVIVGTYKNVGGTATIIGAVAAVATQEDQAAWDATFDVTGATVRVRVTGAANNNVVWHVTAKVYQVGT